MLTLCLVALAALCVLVMRRYYYTRQPVFEESAILKGLSTTLHGEVVQSVLKGTLGGDRHAVTALHERGHTA